MCLKIFVQASYPCILVSVDILLFTLYKKEMNSEIRITLWGQIVSLQNYKVQNFQEVMYICMKRVYYKNLTRHLGHTLYLDGLIMVLQNIYKKRRRKKKRRRNATPLTGGESSGSSGGGGSTRTTSDPDIRAEPDPNIRFSFQHSNGNSDLY